MSRIEKDQLKAEVKKGFIKCYYCGKIAYHVLSNGRPCCSRTAFECPNYSKFDGDRKRQMYIDRPQLIEKQREVGRRNHNRPDVQEKKRQAMLRLHHQDETFIKNYRNGIKHATETKNTPEYKDKFREIGIQKYADKKYKRDYFKKITSEFNGEEKEVMELLNKLYPNMFLYNFRETGFRVDNLRPDFFNKPNRILIDYFGCQYHIKGAQALGLTTDEYAQRRIDRLNKKGWDCLVIWRNELKGNRDALVKKIVDFVESNRIF